MFPFLFEVCFTQTLSLCIHASDCKHKQELEGCKSPQGVMKRKRKYYSMKFDVCTA